MSKTAKRGLALLVTLVMCICLLPATLIVADEVGKTSRDMVWAGGDAVTGAATVILAMGAGKTAAEEIDKAIMGK